MGSRRHRLILFAAFAGMLCLRVAGWAADCNQNGSPDEQDLLPSSFGFADDQAIPLGGSAHTFSLADLDQDGWLDAVSANYGNTVSLLWNAREGTFEPPQIVLSGGEGPRYVAVADLDEDERPDLVIAHDHSSNLTFLLNRGGRIFEPGGGITTPRFPSYALPADIDGDGDLDLGVSIEGSRTLVILSNEGGGQFEIGPSYSGGGYFTAGDLNRDGSLDLAAANDPAVNVLLNSGQGAFKSRLFYPSNLPFAVRAIDLDGAGDLDLVVGGETVATFLNHGLGLFKPHRAFPGGFFRTYVSPADLDGDSDADLAAAGWHTGNTFSLRNDGLGDLRRGDMDLGDVHPVSYMLADDINRDNRPDVVTCNGTSLFVNLNDGQGGLGKPRSRDIGYSTRFLTGDLDGDRYIDLLLPSPRFFSILFNDLGTLRPPVHQMSQVQIWELGDFDGDGDLDMVGGEWDNAGPERLWVSLNAGNGSFPISVESPGEFHWSVQAGDFDRDGDLDLVGSDGRVSGVLLNQGDAKFVEKARLKASSRAAIADLDGDDFPELAMPVSEADRVSVFINQAGTFGEERRFPAGRKPAAIAPADVDLDGDVDLAVTFLGTWDEASSSYAGSGLSVLENRGDATFVTTAGPPLGSGPQDVLAEDVDADGAPDLVVSCTYPGRIFFLLNKGQDSFLPALDREGTDVALADFNGDRSIDAVVGTRGGSATLLLNTSIKAKSRDTNGNAVPDECEGPPFHRGDPDGTGMLDLSDVVFLIDHLFLGGPEPACLESADADNDGAIVLTDGVYLLQHLFLGGPEPLYPGPPGSPCGLDPDAPSSIRAFGCAEYGGC